MPTDGDADQLFAWTRLGLRFVVDAEITTTVKSDGAHATPGFDGDDSPRP